MEVVKPNGSSFRDPSGFVFEHNDNIYRFITTRYEAAYNHLMFSGLYNELTRRKLLIEHREVELPFDTGTDLYKIILPEKIDFFSYPYEWCFEQWRDLLLIFLEINITALQYGMILKDATPFNFTFYKGRLIFFDTLSFTFYREGDNWVAYRQFCESLFGPFALIKYKGSSWGRLFTTFINGVPLSYISKELPWQTYLNPAILLHIHLHAKYTQKESLNAVKKSIGFTKQKLNALLSMLRSTVMKYHVHAEKRAGWVRYYSEQIINGEYLEEKEKIIKKWLTILKQRTITDLGANNGRFTMMAADFTTEVVAVELDSDCVNNLYVHLLQSGKTNITVIQADLMQPSPGIGWNNSEREPLPQRLRADTILGLALIHHLCIANNLPISFFASFISSITRQYAIIEFVPKSDKKVIEMLAIREDIFQAYNEVEFIRCFEKYFTLAETKKIASTDRTLYLWKKR